MAVGGDGTPENYWDDARIALGEVAWVLHQNPGLSREDILPLLLRVKDYGLIPEGVRQAVEGLSPEERQVVTRFIRTLAENHFYVEGGHGKLDWF